MASVRLYSGELAQVDAADIDRVEKLTWYKSGKYAVANISKEKGIWKQVSMHRFITNCGNGSQVDHIDGDKLNNTRNNLRICTQTENGKNRLLSKSNKSGFKGVSYDKKSGKWYASIKCNKKSINLGYHEMPEVAHQAYVCAAKKLHGNFASY